MLARAIARRFDLESVAIALPRGERVGRVRSGRPCRSPSTRVSWPMAFAAAQTSLEFDAYARTYAGHRTIDGRRPHDSARAAAGRHQADRPAGRGGPPDRSRYARRARRGRGDRDRARAVSRRAQGGRADTPERAAEDGAAGVDWPRPADAAHGHSRRGDQHSSAVADGRGAARAERPDPGRGRTPDPAVPEHPRDGPHRCRRDRQRSRAGRIRPKSSPPRATRWSTRCSRHKLDVERRSGRAGAARSAADRHGAGAPAGERRAVRAGGLDDRRPRVA